MNNSNSRKGFRWGRLLVVGGLLGTLTIFLLIVVLVAVSPLINVWRMQSAANALDADTFSSYVDYPVFRENLKRELKAEMLANLQNTKELKDNPFSGLAAIAAPTIVDNLVDSYVSEKGVKKLFENAKEMKLQGEKDSKLRESIEIAKGNASKVSYGYSGVSSFYVEMKPKDSKKVRLVFFRNWLIFWKLSDLSIG